MTSAMVLPGRRKSRLAGLLGIRRVSRPTLSWVILTATTLIVAVVLLIWVLLWLNRPRTGVAGWWVAQRGLTLPVIGYQGEDVRRIARGATGAVPADSGYPAVEQLLRNRMSGTGTRPVVIYLSAAGVSDERGGFLLRPEPGPLPPDRSSGSGPSPISVETLVGLFDDDPTRPKLLILDAGQVGSDRNLGVYANGFMHQLKAYLESKPVKGVVVLSSCAPGQLSWASEADRCSVFGYYVALGMSGKAAGWDSTARGLTVRALSNYVREHVRDWASANRQAEQTPELLGDPDVNFALPRMTQARPASPPAADTAVDKVLALLNDGWTKHDALRARRPFRNTPTLWRQYQETLLHGERLIRAGDIVEAEATLGNLASLGKRIADAAGGIPMEPYWSLALLERPAADANDRAKALAAEVAGANDRIDQALKELVEGSPEPEAPAEEGAKSPAPAPADDPAKKAEAPGSEEDGTPRAEDSAKGQARGTVSSSAKTPKSPRAKPKGGESMLSTLIVKSDDAYPQYLEAQLLVWADVFTKRGPLRDAFRGARGDLLADALRTRRAAERAVAADERISRWTVPLVEAGDILRRRAQDELFGADSTQFESLGKLLEQARERYRQALEVADQATRAIDLVEQLEAELPYYGEWKARRDPRRDSALDPAFVELLAATTSLARQVSAQVQTGSPGADAKAGGEDPLTTHLALVKKWETQTRVVRSAFDRLREDFQGHCAGLAASGGSGRWRDLDAALVVPLIDAELRRQLLQGVRSSTTAGALASPDLAERPLQKSKLSTLVGSDVGTLGGRSSEGKAGGDGGDVASPDPELGRIALRLARLEWGLLELGGASETDLAGLSDTYDSARGSLTGRPGGSNESFDRLSERLRALRAGRARAIQQDRGQAFAALVDADRALRALPLSDALGLSDKPVEALNRYHRHTLLVWQGNRLLQDYSPTHARRVLEDARQYAESEPLREAFELAAAMERARLELKPDPLGSLTVNDWTEQPMAVALNATGNLPEGEATILVGFDPTLPVSVTEKASRISAREGSLLPVHSDRLAGRKDFLVGRTESTHEPLSVRLAPVAFYRGRVFSAERGVDVTLNPASDPVTVTIRQSYEGINKNFIDQFKEHPGQGYLHFGTELQYKLVMTTTKPMKVVVRYGFKEHVESFKTKTLEIGPKKTGEIHDIIKGTDFPLIKEETLALAPLNLMVTIWKDRENGEVQGKAKYVFRVIPPNQYIATFAEFDPASRYLNIWVSHLGSDPVTGPVTIIASVGGGEIRVVTPRSRIATFSFPVPLAVKSVTWRVGVEHVPNAYRETIDTPLPPNLVQPPTPPAQ